MIPYNAVETATLTGFKSGSLLAGGFPLDSTSDSVSPNAKQALMVRAVPSAVRVTPRIAVSRRSAVAMLADAARAL